MLKREYPHQRTISKLVGLKIAIPPVKAGDAVGRHLLPHCLAQSEDAAGSKTFEQIEKRLLRGDKLLSGWAAVFAGNMHVVYESA